MQVIEQEFLSLLQAHEGIIYKLVRLYAYSPEDKEDLYGEIVLQAWKGYSGFRGEAKFSTWLYRICLNTVFTMKRRPQLATTSDNEVTAERADSPQINEDAERLYAAIRHLPETERAIVSLHLDGYDNKEIAEMLGISANLIGVKLHRAKAQLRKLLKDL